MSKFGEAIGQWELNIDDTDMILKPDVNDVKQVRNILVQNTKNKVNLFDKISEFMQGLIVRAYPEEDKEHIKGWVELNINTLLEEVMIAFKWQKREEIAKVKLQQEQELKKMMSDD